MKTLVNITENNWFQEIQQAVFFLYTGHGIDGFPRSGYSLVLERRGEEDKLITGLRWKNKDLPLPEKNDINNIVIGYINNVNEIVGRRLYTDLLPTDKIYLISPN